jgi:photosystem II stability/assembly factor-like uncharacterized protein
MNRLFITFLTFGIIFSFSFFVPKNKGKGNDKDTYIVKSSQLSSFKFRSIGPAMISGRIIDLAVNPGNPSEYYVAAASGSLWKTTDGGIVFKPVFDSQRPYSIGCVTIAPSNPHSVWVGTGENNSQRSVSRGDGVYRSPAGGKTWKNMGLKNSEHIGKIIIHPLNENIVYVAAQGPLWNPGGDRGLYKTTDGGKTWNKVLEIDENTGVSDIAMDPRNPDVIYATSYQRRRHVYTLINGGPGSAVYKSTDGGKSWRKLKNGLPGGDLGRIGITISPVNPDKLWVIVEAAEGKGGIYRSTDRGESWTKVNSRVSVSPQYYNELFADPKDEETIYTMDTYSAWSDDGGKTWKRFSNTAKHVDDHVIWIDPGNTNHILMGCDGGLYESFNHGKTWDYKQNLPLSQFYRVSVDYDKPFYNVYGGTQDNNTVFGPSRTISRNGIVNSDWKITHGGDGFETVIDPEDPNTAYCQSQYGWLVRYNRQTGEELDIKPSEPDNGEAYRWNWNSPVIISNFDHKTLYFAANKLFKSQDRGNSWKVISPDLSRRIDRNKLKVMGKVQSPEAVAKNASTSFYGTIVSLAESPLKQGLIYAGSDDGQISVTENDGDSWEKYTSFPGVPDTSYVSCIITSRFDENTAYASFDNHKRGDYKPYLLKTTDRGKTWISIAGNLPEDETVYSVAQDHVNPKMLFAGTEYGFWFTLDEGKHWVRLKAGLPSIAIRDIDIQRRENDIVLASYGRGFYILDNYAPLREMESVLQKDESYIFPVKDALMFNQSSEWGWRRKGHQGDNFFTADNPPVAAVIRYYFNEDIKTLKQKRKEAEKKALKEGKDIDYPTFEQLAAEDNEIKPYLLFTIKDEKGKVVRKLKMPASKGIKTLNWDMRYAGTYPVGKSSFDKSNGGAPVLPGTYSVEMAKVINGIITPVGNTRKFKVKRLFNNDIQPDGDHKFYLTMAEQLRKMQGLNREINRMKNQTDLIIVALKATPGSNPADLILALKLKKELDSIEVILNGDPSRQKRNAPAAPGLNTRLNKTIWGVWNSSEGPTQTHRNDYAIVEKRGKEIAVYVETVLKDRLDKLNTALDNLGAPYTPGRKSGF